MIHTHSINTLTHSKHTLLVHHGVCYTDTFSCWHTLSEFDRINVAHTHTPPPASHTHSHTHTHTHTLTHTHSHTHTTHTHIHTLSHTHYKVRKQRKIVCNRPVYVDSRIQARHIYGDFSRACTRYFVDSVSTLVLYTVAGTILSDCVSVYTHMY